jgi:competence protein ComGC
MVSFIKEMWRFLRQRKKFWLLPLLLVMALLGVLIVMAHGSVVAPFIYTLF